MKGLPYFKAKALSMLVVILVALSFGHTKAELGLEQEHVMTAPERSTEPPPALAGFPDMDHVPVYPGATVTFTNTEVAKLNNINYVARERMKKVTEFYQEVLPQDGWVLRHSVNGRSQYSWTDPEGKLSWDLQLEVVIGLTLDQSNTLVELEYGRYPNTDERLPTFPDAEQVSTTHSAIEKDFPGGKTPVRVTELTFASKANPQEIANYYRSSLKDYGWYAQSYGWSTRKYGWSPFGEPGSWEGVSPQEGLYFVASHPIWDTKPGIVSSHLLATAKLQKDGLVIVKLHIEEYESTSDF